MPGFLKKNHYLLGKGFRKNMSESRLSNCQDEWIELDESGVIIIVIFHYYDDQRPSILRVIRLTQVFSHSLNKARLVGHIWRVITLTLVKLSFLFVLNIGCARGIEKRKLPAWHCASRVLAMALLSVSVCLSVCLSQVGVLSKRMNESVFFRPIVTVL